MSNAIQNSKYVCIRLAKLEKWLSGTKSMKSAKYFQYIRPFYYDLYRCSFARGSGTFAEGVQVLLYCRKCDVVEIFKKYRDNLPKYKNWDLWLQDDFVIWNYFMPCYDYLIPTLDDIFERSVKNGK